MGQGLNYLSRRPGGLQNLGKGTKYLPLVSVTEGESSMRIICALTFSMIIPLGAITAQIRSEDPVRAITKAFDDHQIVMVGDLHGNKQEYELLRKLIASADLAEKANDIVMEVGNASFQGAVDKYVAGEDVPFDQVQSAWRNSLLIGAASPVYEWLYAAVRDANSERPANRRMRILLCDPPIDWSKVNGFLDVETFLSKKVAFCADAVTHEVIRKHRRALILMGMAHLLRTPRGPASLERRLRAAGASTYLIVTGTNSVGQTSEEFDRVDERFQSLPSPIVLSLKGNWIGRLPALPVVTGGTALSPDPTTLAQGGDALLYLGPRDSLIAINTTESDLAGSAYGREVTRRLSALFGSGAEPFATKRETPEFASPTSSH